MKTQQIKIQVPEPCHEDWNKMTPKDKGAFCSSCEKVVVDFTKMSDRQVVDFLNKNKGKKTCGKFNSFQVDRKISVTTPPPNYYWRLKQLFVGMFVSLSFPAFAKGIEAPSKLKPLPTIDDSDISKEYVNGLVKGFDGNPISAAYVRIYQNGRITKSYAVTDETGKFRLELPQNHKEKSIELKVTAQDYMSESVIYNGEEHIEVVLNYSKQILGKMAFHPIEVEEVKETQGQAVVSELKTPCELPLGVKGEVAVTETPPVETPPVPPIEFLETDIMGDIVMVHPDDLLPQNISGLVVDQYGEPLPFANIVVEGSNQGTTTDIEGNFNLKLSVELQDLESIKLKISYVGFMDQTIMVKGKDAVENKVTVKVTLMEHYELMGIMISVPEELGNPSSFDENYQVPEWKEAGFSSRRAWKEHLNNNQ